MPRPPKHVETFARPQVNSETSLPRSTDIVCLSPLSRRRCSGAITAGGTSLKSYSRASATSLLMSIHFFFCKADMIVLITCKSLHALQCRESLLRSLNRLYGHLSRLAQVDMHAVLRVRCRLKETHPMSLAWEPPSAALRPQTIQIQAPILRIKRYGVCDLRRPAGLRYRSTSG